MFDTSEMPKYKSHKTVHALEIGMIVPIKDGTGKAVGYDLVFENKSFSQVTKPASMFARYVPVSGDFYVIYEDGYESFSPRKAFLEGYTRETQVHLSGSQT